MQIKQIKIENFRCLKHFKLDFAPNVTVLIGRNGAGKTSLLSAIKYAMSVFFTNDKSIGDNVMAAGNPDLHIIKTTPWDFYRDKANDSTSIDLSIKIEASLEGMHLDWEYYKRSTAFASLYQSKYKEAYLTMMNHYEKTGLMPILVYYSDAFPHKDSRISDFAKKSILVPGYMAPNFGYYKWDEDASCTIVWQNRLANSLLKQKTQVKENKIIDAEVNYVCSLLKKFSEPLGAGEDEGEEDFCIKEVFPVFDGEKIYLYLGLGSGREIMFDQLPAGYGRLYSIVLDLAYRMFVIKRDSDLDPKGIVLIDEVDLHLHPSLEQEVLDRFCKTFPSIQFVVSTHSPSVLIRLQTFNTGNRVYRMSEKNKWDAVEMHDLFGSDFATTVFDVMDTPLPKDEINEEIESIIRLFRKGKPHLANSRMEELRKLVSNRKFSILENEIKRRVGETL